MKTSFIFSWSVLTCVCLLFASLVLAGCNASGSGGNAVSNVQISAVDENADSTADEPPLKVIATVFAPYDFVREIAGDRAEASMLLPPGADSHDFEPAPRDLIDIQESDLFIYIGGESEVWVDGILESLDLEKTKVLRLMDVVEVVQEEIVEGMEPEEEEDEAFALATPEGSEDAEEVKEVAYDEHIWTSPLNATVMVETISDALSEISPSDASLFRHRAEAYLEQLEHLISALRQVVSEGQRSTIVFGDRFPFRYLTDDLNLDYYAAFPGCARQTEPKAATVAFLINKVRGEQLPVIFKIEMSNGDIAQTIADETGAEVRTLHSAHNLSREELEAGATYLSLMQGNVEALKEALG